MIKYIMLSALILAGGCTANHTVTPKQVNPEPTRLSTNTHTQTPDHMRPQVHARTGEPIRSHSQARASIVTQASSTSTSWMKGSTLSAKSTQDGIPSELLDLLQGAAGNRTAGQGQMPTGTTGGNTPTTGTGTTGQTGQTNQTGQNAGTNQNTQTGQNTQAGQNTQTGQNNQSSSKDSSQFAKQVLDLVNQERSKAGLGSLSMDDQLSNMAMAKAKDMYDNNYFDHNSPTHGSPFDMMKEYGITYNSAGENIAKGQTTPSQVMKDWMNSPGHKANILNKSYSHIGIAFYNNEWVQEFTG